MSLFLVKNQPTGTQRSSATSLEEKEKEERSKGSCSIGT